jgi:S-adenosylmethionine:tRNA ribosyltransferase-isomerase
MQTADYDYFLPPELIAQVPAPQRDASRLLVFRRPDGQIEHRGFSDLVELLRPGDILVLNDSKVIPARLRGRNSRTGGHFEILLVEENATNDWWAMLRPGKRAREGTRIEIRNLRGETTGIQAVVTGANAEGHRRIRFEGATDIHGELAALGEIPLPPYITRAGLERMEEDRMRYQTVYAGAAGSVAAPTAGLHFTEAILRRLKDRGVDVAFVTLHVGLGTFAPVKSDTVENHIMHEERYRLSPETAGRIESARAAGGRVVAVGTTTLRVLESVAAANAGRLAGGSGRTRIFIYPPKAFLAADALLTNFHLPRSTLLMLACAFASPGSTTGRERMLAAYAEAVRERYRFFSYGDAMLIL